MIEIQNTGYDNIKEIDGISGGNNDCYYETGKDILRGICYSIRHCYKRIHSAPFTTFIFNGVISERYPGMLSRVIKKAKLGDIMETKSKVNPNSDNVIRVYVWHVDKKELSKWFKKNRHKHEDDNE